MLACRAVRTHLKITVQFALSHLKDALGCIRSFLALVLLACNSRVLEIRVLFLGPLILGICLIPQTKLCAFSWPVVDCARTSQTPSLTKSPKQDDISLSLMCSSLLGFLVEAILLPEKFFGCKHVFSRRGTAMMDSSVAELLARFSTLQTPWVPQLTPPYHRPPLVPP